MRPRIWLIELNWGLGIYFYFKYIAILYSYKVIEPRWIRYYNYLLWHPTRSDNTFRLGIMVVSLWAYQFKFNTVTTDGNWCTAHLHAPSIRFNIYNQSIIEAYVNERLEEKCVHLCATLCITLFRQVGYSRVTNYTMQFLGRSLTIAA